MKFHERLKELREKTGKSQKDYAASIGVEQSTYNKWENGRNIPDYETVFLLATDFGVSTDYLLGKEDVPFARFVNLAKETGLSARAIESLEIYKQEDMKNSMRVLNFLIECASQELLENLYHFLFSDLYFVNQDDPENAYRKKCLVAYPEAELYRAFTIDSTDLANMFFSKVQEGLYELREGIEETLIYKDIQEGRM